MTLCNIIPILDTRKHFTNQKHGSVDLFSISYSTNNAISARLLAYVDYTWGFLGLSIPRKQKGILIPISSGCTESLQWSKVFVSSVVSFEMCKTCLVWFLFSYFFEGTSCSHNFPPTDRVAGGSAGSTPVNPIPDVTNWVSRKQGTCNQKPPATTQDWLPPCCHTRLPQQTQG